MDKVKLPRDVAETIERVWSVMNDELCSKYMRMNNWNFLYDEVVGHNLLDTDYRMLSNYAENHPIEYMTALVNGYEVEETPEDKVTEYYNSGRRGQYAEDWDSDGYQRALGVRTTLDLLGIKIVGVNHE